MYTALQLVVSGDPEQAAGDKPPPYTGRALAALERFLGLLDELTRASETESLTDLFDGLLARIGYKTYLSEAFDDGDDRWENVQELRGVAQQYADQNPLGGLEAFLEGIALVSDVDDLGELPDTVTLITLHQAKGLEFPVVFICGLEEGIFPHMRSFDDPAQMEEERRLAYVGVTRAKERLYLTRAFRRTRMGSRMPSPPSRFLRDIPEHLLDVPIPSQPAAQRAAPPGWGAPSRIPANAPREPVMVETPASFRVGEHVRHKQFGDGIVVNCEATRSDQVVTVAFKGGVGIKRLSLSMAPLERV